MQIQPLVYKQFGITRNPARTIGSNDNGIDETINAFVQSSKLPDSAINYFTFDEELVSKIIAAKEKSIQPVLNIINTDNDEKTVTAGLYLLNRLIDAGVKGIENTYPSISKFNYTESPNIKVMLSGVYRKTQIPDAFGPLMTMYMKDSKNPKSQPFDSSEEVGGALLSYLNNKELAQDLVNYLKTQACVNNYSNNLKKQQKNF